jgi:hypothetical protein
VRIVTKLSKLPIAVLGGALLLTAAAAIGQQVRPGLAANPATTCLKSLLLNFEIIRDGETQREAPVWRAEAGTPFFFEAGMTIDADGAPNAYNADNTGLDDLANAGSPAHWDGLVADADGTPFIQGPDDPFPGYYVSCTALTDRTKGQTDPSRYVDASKIPYVVLPGNLARDAGARLGDFAVVYNTRNGKSSYAIFADIGTFGEGSIALADNLGIWSDARQGGTRGGIVYHVFPGSGNGKPRTVEEINTETAKLVEDWGGTDRINACAADQN